MSYNWNYIACDRICLFACFVWDRVSLWSPAGLELSIQPCSLECCDFSNVHHNTWIVVPHLPFPSLPSPLLLSLLLSPLLSFLLSPLRSPLLPPPLLLSLSLSLTSVWAQGLALARNRKLLYRPFFVSRIFQIVSCELFARENQMIKSQFWSLTPE
jgi:hypothetical protein